MAERPTSGVFIAWDEEEVDVERRDAGGLRDRTVAVARRTVTKYVLWTNAVADENIATAERYAEDIHDQHDNVRVEVFTGKPGSCRTMPRVTDHPYTVGPYAVDGAPCSYSWRVESERTYCERPREDHTTR